MVPAFEVVIRCPAGEIRSWVDAEGCVRTSVHAEFGAEEGASAETVGSLLSQASDAAKTLLLRSRSVAQRAPFAEWFAERCVAESNSRELSSELLRDYTAWSAARGFSPMSATAFGNALRDRGICLAGKSSDGQKYRGPIRLKRGEPPQLAAVR